MTDQTVTILGSSGYVGSHIVDELRRSQMPYFAPSRAENLFNRPLGHIIYCIGLTADFRSKPFETVEAHVCCIKRLLEEANFESLTYFSSTRVYGTKRSFFKNSLAREDDDVVCNSNDSSDLYNLSKLMGESILIAASRVRGLPMRAVRLSNVYGGRDSSQNFLTAILQDALMTGAVTLNTSLESAKDYVSVFDVAKLLPQIALRGSQAIYNLASGENVSNAALSEMIRRLIGASFSVSSDARTVTFPTIDISRIINEFQFQPSSLHNNLNNLIVEFRQNLSSNQKM